MVKADKSKLARSLDVPDPAIRFFLFHGEEQSGSQALAERLLAGLKAAKAIVSGNALKGDPGMLAGEAAAMSLFGETRLLWIEPAGDDTTDAVQLLLEAPACESPVVAVSGALKRGSTLLKLAEASGAALAHASYPVEGRDAERLTIELGQAEGLRMTADVAARVALSAGYNQAVIGAELRKFALYLDSSVEGPRELDNEVIDVLGADSGESDFRRIGDLALDGRMQELGDMLQRLPPGGIEGISIVRTLQRRLLQLVTLRARIEQGERLDAVLTSLGKSLFWKEKPLLQRLLSQWSAGRLDQLARRVAELERVLILNPAPTEAALGQELVAIARAARR